MDHFNAQFCVLLAFTWERSPSTPRKFGIEKVIDQRQHVIKTKGKGDYPVEASHRLTEYQQK